MAEGTIQRLVSDRGFGFIRPTDMSGTGTSARQKDLFFHASQVRGVRYEDLREGDTVTFVEEQDPRGRGAMATDVERTKRGAMSGEAEDAGPQWPPASASTRVDDATTSDDWGAGQAS